jgi:predicted esterase
MIDIAQQFQSAQKLPHLNWIFPNALENQEASTTAWYTPTSFSPIPVGKSSSGAPADTIDESSESQSIQSEILDSVEYICTLIDEEVKKGVAPKRIIIGGFSQGCAVALTTGLGSRYAAKTAAVVGLSGYMPNGQAIADAIHGFDESGGIRVFLAHGTRDMLIPVSVGCLERDEKCLTWTRCEFSESRRRKSQSLLAKKNLKHMSTKEWGIVPVEKSLEICVVSWK